MLERIPSTVYMNDSGVAPSPEKRTIVHQRLPSNIHVVNPSTDVNGRKWKHF